MIPCPDCVTAGLTSRIREGPKTKTGGASVQYYDEDQQPHVHDSTAVISRFFCTNGHSFEHRGITKCPTCNAQVDPTGEDQFGRPK